MTMPALPVVARWLIAGKLDAIFSFLFGVGFVLQLESLSRARVSPVATYLRKLAILLGFGLVHAVLLWQRDVLLTYVAIGLVLLFVRKLSDRALLAVAFVVLLAASVASSVHRAATPAPVLLADADAKMDALLATLASASARGGSSVDVTMGRLRYLREWYADPWSLASQGQMLGAALLGAYAARRRLLTTPYVHRPLFRKILTASIVIAFAGVVAAFVLGISPKLRALSLPSAALGAAHALHRPAMMIAYVSAFMLLFTSGRAPAWLDRLAYAGRMPLTNYLAQSVLCTSIFYVGGLALHDGVGPALGLATASALYGLEVAWSAWWLRRFELGPIEWVWRALTYGTPPDRVNVTLFPTFVEGD